MSIRTERVASVIKNDLGRILQKYQRNNMITVTGVTMTPDLSIAKVNLSVLDPGGDEKMVFDSIVEKNTQIRTELAALIRHQVRKIPEIHFYDDDSAEHAQRMENLFRKARERKSDQPDDTEEK